MKPESVKQESESPKREPIHTAGGGPPRAKTYKPCSCTLSHVAPEKRKGSRAPSIPASPTGQGDRSKLREIAETPDIAISRRPAETQATNIGRRLPVRTTKVVPSIEVGESFSAASSSESEETSASEYDDERHHPSQRGPVRKPTTKGRVSKPNARAPAVGSTAALPPVANPAETVQAPTRLVPQAFGDTSVADEPNPSAAAPVTASATTVPPPRATGKTVYVAKTTTVPTTPSTPASPPSKQVLNNQPRPRPVKLKEDPDAWWAKRKGKKQLSKKDQKEVDDYERRQRQGTANPCRPTKKQFERVFRLYHERMAQLRSTASGSVPSAQPRESMDVDEGSHHISPNLEEPVTEDVSICRSIERDQTPNLVDQLTGQVSGVIDLEDVVPEHTPAVKGEASEVRGLVASAPERRMLSDVSMFEVVPMEVAALRCELQFFKGQVSAYEKTLEVDGLQLQNRTAFEAGVRKKKSPQEPKNREELASRTRTSSPNELGRQNLEHNGEGEQTEVPRGDPIPSSMTEETDSERSEPEEPGLTGRDSGKRARSIIGQGPGTVVEDEENIENTSKERPSKRPKKGKLLKKEKEGQRQGEIVAPAKAPELELSVSPQKTADQPRASDPDEEKDRQLIKRTQTRRSTATSAPSLTDIHTKPSPAHNGSTSPQQRKTVRAAAQKTTAACGAQPTERGPEATRPGGPGVINNHLTSTGAARIPAPLAAQQQPASGANKSRLGGRSGSEPSVWTAGVNSIPLGPRQRRIEPPRGQTTHYRWNRPWQRPYDRREVFLPDSLPRCVCSLLHPYFESGVHRRPSLEAFPGTRQEFFANVEQIVNCRGHDKEMIIFCEGLWASETANRKVSPRHANRI